MCANRTMRKRVARFARARLKISSCERTAARASTCRHVRRAAPSTAGRRRVAPGRDAMLELDPVARGHAEQVGGAPDHIVLELADLGRRRKPAPTSFPQCVSRPSSSTGAHDDTGEMVEIDGLALDQRGRRDQFVRRAGFERQSGFRSGHATCAAPLPDGSPSSEMTWTNKAVAAETIAVLSKARLRVTGR